MPMQWFRREGLPRKWPRRGWPWACITTLPEVSAPHDLLCRCRCHRAQTRRRATLLRHRSAVVCRHPRAYAATPPRSPTVSHGHRHHRPRSSTEAAPLAGSTALVVIASISRRDRRPWLRHERRHCCGLGTAATTSSQSHCASNWSTSSRGWEVTALHGQGGPPPLMWLKRARRCQL